MACIGRMRPSQSEFNLSTGSLGQRDLPVCRVPVNLGVQMYASGPKSDKEPKAKPAVEHSAFVQPRL